MHVSVACVLCLCKTVSETLTSFVHEQAIEVTIEELTQNFCSSFALFALDPSIRYEKILQP